MAGGQEENVGVSQPVVWTGGGLGRGRRNCFVAGDFSIDKGLGAVKEGSGSE